MSAGGLFLFACAVLAALFGALFLLCRRVGNYGWVDVAWAYGFIFTALLFAGGGSGWWPRKCLMAAPMAAWALRLGTHLLRRVRREHPVEDARYAALRERWGAPATARFLVFFLGQALLVAALSLPLLLACRDGAPRWHPLEGAGLALWCAAFAGEILADVQISRFKRAAGNAGAVCRVGLWRCSRHPNYFFESLVWWAYFLMAAGSPWGWTTLYCPLLMLVFLLWVTGIPPAEARALRSKGEAYREYQRSTSAFIPWFPSS